jgi:hypothetical protein
VAGGWRRLHNEELHNLYTSSNIMTNIMGDEVTEDELGGHVARVGRIRNIYNILTGKPEGKRPLGRPRCR